MSKAIVRFLRFSFALFSLLGLLLLNFPSIPHAKAARIGESKSSKHLPLENSTVSFEENRGQFDDRVRFAARTGGSTIFLTASEAVYVLPINTQTNDDERLDQQSKPITRSAFALRMKLSGANPQTFSTGEEIKETRSNYFKGDEANWKTNIPNYGAVRFDNIYDGVQMVWQGRENGAVRFDFIVDPDADAEQMALEFEGADKLEIDDDGNLIIQTPAGVIKHARPFSFQEVDGLVQEVASSFRIEENRVKFNLGEYDRSRPLTIDPTVTLNNLAVSTFVGSFADEFSNDIAVDSSGNTYITGRTLSTTFPTTAGTFDTTANGFEDVFVTKINAAGTGVIFSTFLGGTFYDEGYGIEVDSTGNIYVTGVASAAFPTTAGAFDETFNGGSDVFVTKLNPTGTALLYSTYVGASNSDIANDIAVDSGGNAYLAVRTSDAFVDYPTTPGAFDTTHNGLDDVAVTKLNPTGTALVYSTFLGGSNIDLGRAIAVNTNGEAFVAGTATDDVTDFPTTAGAFDTTHNGATDFFATKLSADGSALVFSTFVGGSGIDNANAMALDGAGNMYIVGIVSPGFPTTAGVVDTTIAGGSEIGVSKISATGSTLAYSTYLGGTQSETGSGVAVDPFGNVYVTGSNFGGDFPATSGAFDTTFNGSNDAILSVLNQNASALIYSTYLGGGGNDTANRVALDSIGNVYLTGQTAINAAPFPTTSGAYQPFPAGGNDAFVAKFGDYSISGKVVDPNGNPVSSVLIALSGQVSGTVLTGSDGRFSFLDTVLGEPHAVSATRSGYSINPSIFNIANMNNNRELIFVAAVGSPTGGSGGTLRFENLTYNKSENGTTVSVTVNRTGNVTDPNPVTVDFTTENATAVAGQDFVQSSGVLTFNILETTKTINIPLINDATLEPRENFSIVLSNPTNNADIEINRERTNVQIIDEDLGNGHLLISEFRERGRLGANDEFVKLFNPNDFDVTIQTADGSDGVTLARSNGNDLTTVATIPNLVTIPARGHFLLTNNNPNGGFSLINYPTGTGTTTGVGDQTFSADIPDNSNLVLLNKSGLENVTQSNLLDSVSFAASVFSEGKHLQPMTVENSEMSYVRKFTAGGLQDTDNNSADFMLVDNHARAFAGSGRTKIFSILGAPAPETSESLRLWNNEQIAVDDFGTEVYDPVPVPNGSQGTLTVYRKITNHTDQPILALRLRAFDFATFGSPTQRRFSSRPDFRLLSSPNEGATVKGVTLAAENLQPNGGGLNSTLTIDSITPNDPLLPNQSVIVAIRFGVMRYGRHPVSLAVEALQ